MAKSIRKKISSPKKSKTISEMAKSATARRKPRKSR